MAFVRVALLSLHVQKLASCPCTCNANLCRSQLAQEWLLRIALTTHFLPPTWAQDEGHKVKNPHMKLAAALRRVPARLRVIISGTPIQVGRCAYGLMPKRGDGCCLKAFVNLCTGDGSQAARRC